MSIYNKNGNQNYIPLRHEEIQNPEGADWDDELRIMAFGYRTIFEDGRKLTVDEGPLVSGYLWESKAQLKFTRVWSMGMPVKQTSSGLSPIKGPT